MPFHDGTNSCFVTASAANVCGGSDRLRKPGAGRVAPGDQSFASNHVGNSYQWSREVGVALCAAHQLQVLREALSYRGVRTSGWSETGWTGARWRARGADGSAFTESAVGYGRKVIHSARYTSAARLGQVRMAVRNFWHRRRTVDAEANGAELAACITNKCVTDPLLSRRCASDAISCARELGVPI